jgi:acetyl-CoA acyltransferase
VLARVPQLKAADIDDVIVGCASTHDLQEGNFAKDLVIRAGLPDEVPAVTINRFCSSGLQSIAFGVHSIRGGQNDVVVAGGAECMSMLEAMATVVPKNRDAQLADLRPGAYLDMGITAENVAAKYGITRAEMEAMAVESHAKAAAAQKAGAFKREIVPITVKGSAGERTLSEDEGIRPGTTAEVLAQLKPSFKADGVVTAAVSSQMSDGAAFVVLMSGRKVQALGVKPIARLVAFSVAGVPCEIMGIGPIAAVPKVLKRSGFTLDKIDVIELNEAFAAQAIPCIRELGLPPAKVNPRGGAMALGHPLGATGAVLTCKALSYLEDTGGRYALVTMCVGGGQGAAGIWERL